MHRGHKTCFKMALIYEVSLDLHNLHLPGSVSPGLRTVGCPKYVQNSLENLRLRNFMMTTTQTCVFADLLH